MTNARFELLRATPSVNGIETIDVNVSLASDGSVLGASLIVGFVRDLGLGDLANEDFQIVGGDRIVEIQVVSVFVSGREVLLTLDRIGDFSPYVLRVAPKDPARAALFDPIFRERGFSFRASCPTDADCREDTADAPPDEAGPEIDYLARDYATFRRTMLDRMATLLPEWTERNPADVGVAVVEVLAYVADRLAYRQDAIATEAYLGTARSRISVRRHARLVDYLMHDGRNARTFLHFQVATDLLPAAIPQGTPVFARTSGLAPRVDAATVDPAVLAFETMEPSGGLFVAHNDIALHDWGIEEATLAQGATAATLVGPLPDLHAGDWLMLAEARGPQTGAPEDADRAKRHPVRILTAIPDFDPLAATSSVVRIEWGADDALPFDLCLSHRAQATDGSRLIENIATAWGNLVLADHGRTQPASVFDPALPTPFEDVTQAAPIPLAVDTSARAVLSPPDPALPALDLTDLHGDPWDAQRDLLASDEDARAFVLEVDDRNLGRVRFGDGVNGRRPDGTFFARYRIGGGERGNVPLGALVHLGLEDARIASVVNPLPAVGGIAPEATEHARQAAPFAYRTNLRAVTEADYAHFAGLHAEVQKAVARYRWTGSWRTIFVLVDRRGGKPVDDDFREEIVRFLEPYRMAGHDLEVRPPRFVPLEIALEVCTGTNRFREDVAREVRRALLPYLDPDRFTFGTNVALSPLVAAAQGVPGVQRVRATTFGRQNDSSGAALQAGTLTLGPLEVARLDDDPDFPEHGRLALTVVGGRV